MWKVWGQRWPLQFYRVAERPLLRSDIWAKSWKWGRKPCYWYLQSYRRKFLSEMASVKTLMQEYLWQDSDHGKKARALTSSEHGGKEAVRVRTLAFTLSKELLEGLETKSVTIWQESLLAAMVKRVWNGPRTQRETK